LVVVGLGLGGAFYWKNKGDEEQQRAQAAEQELEKKEAYERSKREARYKELKEEKDRECAKLLFERCMKRHFEDEDVPTLSWICYTCGGNGVQFNLDNVASKCPCCFGTGNH
jgi:hypothetical protein